MVEGRCLDEAVLALIRKQRSDGYLLKLIDLLLREAPSRIEEAWAGGRTGDVRKTAVAAHTLACLADNVGAVALRALASEAERAADSAASPVSPVTSASPTSPTSHSEGAARLPAILFDLEVAWAETRACLLDAKLGIFT